MHSSTRSRARRLGVDFAINAEEILKLIGDGRCPVFGAPFDLSSRKVGDWSATLDKFAPSLGYVPGNCFVISKLANSIKQNATSAQVRRVSDWMDSVEKGLL